MSESAADAVTPALVPSMDFSAVTDADLIEWMAVGDACAAEAHAAFTEFYGRHAQYIFAVCERRYGGEAEDIVADTFRRVYESASQFDRNTLVNVQDATAARLLVRAWMGQIIRWVAADHFAERDRHGKTVTPKCITSLPDKTCADPANPAADSELVTQVRNVISTLSEREQAIAWTIAHSWCPELGRLRWTQEDLDTIGERFNLTRENIRQIRTRLIRRLRLLLEPILNAYRAAR
jgi:RNA polymerase sigma factor (sigma-70 family)